LMLLSLTSLCVDAFPVSIPNGIPVTWELLRHTPLHKGDKPLGEG